MIEVKVSGDFKKTDKFLDKLLGITRYDFLDKYGQIGVDALRSATPKDTGLTADSWYYEIIRKDDYAKIVWKNSNKTSNGIPIVILLQYGHATGTGGYVYGIDFINPALKPVFEEMIEDMWKEVKRS